MKKALLVWLSILIIAGVPINAYSQTISDSAQEKRKRVKLSRHFLKESKALINDNKASEALPLLDSVLAIDAKNPDAHYYKASILVQSGDTTQATLILTDGISKAPLSSKLKISLARIYLAQNNVTGASELIDNILAIKPRQGEALYLKGVTLLEQNDTAQAVEIFQKVLQFTLLKGKK